jgi:metallophosphoesterase (TIGR00282 family)
MPINLLMFGDIVGSPGRLAVRQCLPALREQFSADLVLANAENAAAGSGLLPNQFDKLVEAGVAGMTLGDHVFRKAQIIPYLEKQSNLIRPANLSSKAKGRGWMRLRVGGEQREGPSVYVITLLGRLFNTSLPCNDPFETVDRVLSKLPEANPTVIVEMHGEATSEKQAMGWYLNGRVAAVLGTHTHIPTADARLLPKGNDVRRQTGYITDLGMSGPQDSVLGRRVDRVLTHMTTNMPAPFDVAEGNPRVNGVYLQIDETTGSARHIERVEMAADANKPPFTAG